MWLQSLAKSLHHQHISTHTSRVGCDYNHRVFLSAYENFYSHIPCGMWRTGNGDMFIEMTNFYSHIPCGMWRRWCQMLRFEVQISTHTSRVGCDFGNIYARCNTFHFYSHIPCGMWHQPKPPQHQQEGFLLTHPVWDVTQNVCHVFFYTSISTHTSRVGCDSRMQLGFSCIFISTHTSRVGCDSAGIPLGSPGYIFLLTHPVWDVTSRLPLLRQRLLISTHTSRVGCDIISKITVKNHQ